jgi:hypothetical protein
MFFFSSVAGSGLAAFWIMRPWSLLDPVSDLFTYSMRFFQVAQQQEQDLLAAFARPKLGFLVLRFTVFRFRRTRLPEAAKE